MVKSIPRHIIIFALGLLFSLQSFAQAKQTKFMLGLDVFMRGYTHVVKGRRVGLLTNQSGVDSKGRSTIDLLNAHPNVNLVKLFCPEHGIRGKVLAGRNVSNSRDRRTGLPIISLYGKNGYRPKPQQLADIDVLIYDIQDVGSRAYTYIWSMTEAMTACGKLGVPMIVLDRPCVYGANTVDGPMCSPTYKSLLTRFPIPRLYGMTCGEIARYFNAGYRLNCPLYVIPMSGYKRGMLYERTGLKWVAPSPNIPNLNAARCFPATGTLGVLGNVHIGIHTNLPFQIVGAPWLDARQMAADLTSYNLPGIKFAAIHFVSPRGAIFGGKAVNAVTLQVTQPGKFRPATTELVFLIYLSGRYPNHFIWTADRAKKFDRAMGTATVRQSILRGDSFRDIVKRWRGQHAVFEKYRRAAFIYQ